MNVQTKIVQVETTLTLLIKQLDELRVLVGGRPFKVGDEVVSKKNGKGIVSYFKEVKEEVYPMVVHFEGHSESYTFDGRNYSFDKLPDLELAANLQVVRTNH